MEQNDNHKALVLIVGLSLQNCKMLRNEMREYCKIENKTHRSNVLMDSIRRIHANLYSVAILSRESIKHGDSTMLKLPMGLILRNCFMDSLYAIYLASLDEAQFEEEVTVLNKDYACSLPSRKEVWIDKAHELGIDGLEYWYDDMIMDKNQRLRIFLTMFLMLSNQRAFLIGEDKFIYTVMLSYHLSKAIHERMGNFLRDYPDIKDVEVKWPSYMEPGKIHNLMLYPKQLERGVEFCYRK